MQKSVNLKVFLTFLRFGDSHHFNNPNKIVKKSKNTFEITDFCIHHFKTFPLNLLKVRNSRINTLNLFLKSYNSSIIGCNESQRHDSFCGHSTPDLNHRSLFWPTK
jgi:D-lyxose ketol-isomerase